MTQSQSSSEQRPDIFDQMYDKEHGHKEKEQPFGTEFDMLKEQKDRILAETRCPQCGTVQQKGVRVKDFFALLRGLDGSSQK